MILMVVRPIKQGGYELLEVRTEELDRHGVNGEFDVTEGRFDDFAVGGGEEDEEG